MESTPKNCSFEIARSLNRRVKTNCDSHDGIPGAVLEKFFNNE